MKKWSIRPPLRYSISLIPNIISPSLKSESLAQSANSIECPDMSINQHLIFIPAFESSSSTEFPDETGIGNLRKTK
jgi:hypothetical protein